MLMENMLPAMSQHIYTGCLFPGKLTGRSKIRIYDMALSGFTSAFANSMLPPVESL